LPKPSWDEEISSEVLMEEKEYKEWLEKDGKFLGWNNYFQTID
jgi:hypothetical protein